MKQSRQKHSATFKAKVALAAVKGDQTLEAGLPESFNVLMKELQALCLNVELIDPQGGPVGRKGDDVIAAEEE